MQTARAAKLRRVLAAALGTNYYRPWLAAASLDSPGKIADISGYSEALHKLPPLPAEIYVERAAEFRSLHPENGRLPALVHPLPGPLRIALLTEGFRTSRRVRAFPDGLGAGLARFRPQVLAGPPARIEQVARALVQGGLRMPPPTHALIVLLRPDEPLLNETQRSRLWSLFHVPVFQQVLGFDGELVAWECEAHLGLHVVEEGAIVESCGQQAEDTLLITSLTNVTYPMLRLVTPWRGALTRRVCSCGRPGERIIPACEGTERAAGIEALQESKCRAAVRAVLC